MFDSDDQPNSGDRLERVDRHAWFDVAVIGGGTSGVMAAIQAGRLGARTLLVEKNGMLGGTTTVGGVALPGLFHAWGQQIIAGIGWDLVTRSTQLAGIQLPDFTDFHQPHYRLQVPVVPALYAGVLDDAVLDAAVDLRLHTMTAAVGWEDDHWRVLLCGKEGLSEVRAHRLIDCTGDADVVGLAGLDRRRNEQRQPGTIMVRLGGYDPSLLDFDLLNGRIAEAVDDGRLKGSDFASKDKPARSFLRNRGANAIHVLGTGAAGSRGRTEGEVEGRRVLRRIFSFLRDQPGLENLTLEECATECGVRESHTIVGRASITVADYTSGRRWPDAVCNSFYPIDVHQPDGDGIDIRPLAEGVVPTIPRAAMLPRYHDYIAVAGRSIDGDQAANSAYRVQATCMATGQAAGAMAALAADAGQAFDEVPLEQLRRTLLQHGAIVPGLPVVAVGDDHSPSIPNTGVSGR